MEVKLTFDLIGRKVFDHFGGWMLPIECEFIAEPGDVINGEMIYRMLCEGVETVWIEKPTLEK